MTDMSAQPHWVPTDTFGGRLILLRHQLGLTIEEAAERTGQKPATWSTWERGSMPRSMAAIVAAISLATGVSREWLMWGGPLSDPGSGGQPSSGRRLSDTELMQYRSRLTVTAPVKRAA